MNLWEVKDKMAIEELNEKQKKFCELYVECENGTQSAKGAGYADTSAHVQASKMLKMPKIKKEIARLRQLQGIDVKADKEQVVEALLRMIADPKTEPQHMLTAIDKLARIEGWFKNDTTIEVNHNTADKLSDEELTKRLAELQQSLAINQEDEQSLQ